MCECLVAREEEKRAEKVVYFHSFVKSEANVSPFFAGPM